ncbi:MAG TPA: neutral zinc metallopeptidase [Candidatus Dormibacteraeota bacterium]|nr:neutral zinc metallopeptidase [Candidatus Dormibacteraeota bacterium]
MRWEDQRRSDNVEDRRGFAPRRGIAISGGGLLLILAIAFITGENPLTLLEAVSGGPSASVDAPQSGGPPGAPSDQLGQFASAVLGSTEDVWGQVLAEDGGRYQPPVMVLFSSAVESACGYGSAAVGPFYCPLDDKLYLDLAFFDELERRFGAPGDFAQAYVIAHEVGHHVQNQLGITRKVQAAQQRGSQEDANALSVRMELQADCLAGVWAQHSKLLEAGDAEEGLRAASAIGDDQIQRRSQGYTVPETWTHGSSEMRTRWLRRGMQSGDINQCDTFAAAEP